MLTVSAQDVIENAAGFSGLDRENLAADEFLDLRGFLANRLAYAWNARSWADLERTQRRFFRELYDPGLGYDDGEQVYDASTGRFAIALDSPIAGDLPFTGTDEVLNAQYWGELLPAYSADDYDNTAPYVPGDLVFYPANGLYYQRFGIGTTTGTAPTDDTYWGELPPLDRYVAYEQTGEDAIGDVMAVTERNPRVTADAGRVEFTISENGVQVLAGLGEVWVTFRLRVPLIRGKAWDATASYVAGQQVYFESTTVLGNFYNCVASAAAGESPATQASKWEIVELPRRFQQFLENGMAADWLAEDEPQRSAKYNAMAEGFLMAEVIRHDNQVADRRTDVRTR